MTGSHPYAGRVASLATQHGKWRLISPTIEQCLGLRIVDVDADTDSLGTFSGEIPRRGTPRETVVAKARLGMTEIGVALGLANEGTIGPHPAMPFVNADVEIVVLVDDELGTSVLGVETEFGIPMLAVDVEPERWEEISLADAGFPHHGLIVRPTVGFSPIFKGIHDLDELKAAVFECSRLGEGGTVRIESDFRAHHHPSRQAVIARAAERLAHRLSCLCPRCGTPGWGVGRRESGARCSLCGIKTRQALLEYSECPKCDFTQTDVVCPPEGVDPAQCPRCNP